MTTIDSFLSKTCNEQRGNELGQKKFSDTRIIFQNINSLRPKSMVKWKSTLDRTEHLEGEIIGLCETSVNWSKKSTTKMYKDILRKNLKRMQW
jgi:hypothetical protein